MGAYIVILDDQGNYHLFAHCQNNSFQGLTVGRSVEAGEAIAVMGMTGNANTEIYATGQGAHVHYEVREGVFSPGASVDPSRWAGIPSDPHTPNIGGMVGAWYMP